MNLMEVGPGHCGVYTSFQFLGTDMCEMNLIHHHLEYIQNTPVGTLRVFKGIFIKLETFHSLC